VRAVRPAALSAALCVVLLVLSAWLAPLPERLGEAGSTVVTYRDGTTAHVFLAPDDRWRVPTPPQGVDPAYVDALLRTEDKRFRIHPGVDPLAVARAVVVNLRSGRVVTGASTLTLQLVRVLEPRPRTLWSKAIEAHRALTLELHLSKDEILDAYLRFAPYGRNLEGVEAGALAYFGHSATALSPDEIVTLLAVPQNPSARYPSAANAERLRAARQQLARFLLADGALQPAEQGTARTTLEEIDRSEVPQMLRRFPREAPHLATTLRDQHPAGVRIATTLDRGTQRMVEEIVAIERDALGRQGIHNGAVVVVHSQTRALRAVVGNLDFWDEAHAGQMSALSEPRSPGSALKPFLYAAAIDRGLALPETLVSDVPRTWGTYAPTNYDGQFRGVVPLQDALSASLNLPFVSLLSTLGLEASTGVLRGMGARSLSRKPGYYGLSMAVGGVELTPLELAGFYTTLANQGRAAALRDQPGPSEHGLAVFSPGAAHLTTRALQLRDRPDFPSRRRVSGGTAQVAWKTGTSFGHRDAWAAGFGADHTAVVWLGNLDYTPARDLVGAQAAGPLLFDVLGAVDRGQRLDNPVPDDLAQVDVCAYSGRIPTGACTHRKTVLAPRSAVPTERCGFHQRLAVDVHTGEALTPACRAGRAWEERTYVVWPAAVRRHLKDQDRDLPSPPPYAAGCTPQGVRRPPVITQPQQGMTAMLIPGMDPTEQELFFAADADRSDARLSWFVDGAFLGTYEVDERVWWTPVAGEHVAVVVDETGRRARRAFAVSDPSRR